MSLPVFQTPDQVLTLLQTTWAKDLNALLAQPWLRGSVLQSIPLISGDNTINHLLSRKLQGWWLVRQRSSANVYDKQDTNPMPNKTLVLNSSAPVVVDILVF